MPEPTAVFDDNSFGQADGRNRERQAGRTARPGILRYYDTGRDFQPGLQRAEGRARPGGEQSIDFPGALGADDARALANDAAQRADWGEEALRWRVAELDPAIRPGSVVRAPGETGLWRIATWEWRDSGIELELVRLPPTQSASSNGDTGKPAVSPDLQNLPTMLQAFSLPAASLSENNSPACYAALSAAGPNWKGAALFALNAGQLIDLGQTSRQRSTIGALATALGGSACILLESHAAVEVQLVANDLLLDSVTASQLASGGNRAFIGGEVLQFAHAEPLGSGRWRLLGLLRGRGGTEDVALSGHPVGTGFALIEDTLVRLASANIPASPDAVIAAIGLADPNPVLASISDSGLTQRPLVPVHPGYTLLSNGDLRVCWTRRGRGAWDWLDQVDTPLVEDTELYEIGVGLVSNPAAIWQSSEPQLVITASNLASLAASNSGTAIWVRQIGRFAKSPPLKLGAI